MAARDLKCLSSPRAVLFLLAALCALVYGRALLGQFVYDDRWVIVENPALRSMRPLAYLTDAQTYAAPGSGLAERVFRPLAVLSFALDYQAWGQAAWAYHLESVLWHLLSAWLLFLLARRVLKSVEAATLAACVFLVHPVQIESVAWITQRANLICVSGLLAALYWLSDASPWSLFGGLAAYGAALLAKEEALVFLGIFWLWEVGSGLKLPPSRTRVKIYAGLTLMTAAYAALRSYSGHSWSQLEPGQHAASFLVNLQMATVCFAYYLGKIVLPMSLRVSYDYPLPINAWYLLGAEILSLAYLAAAAVLWRSRQKFPALVLCWILLALAPTLHVFPLLTFIAERYVYFAIAGAALGAGWLYERAPKARSVFFAWLAFLCAAAFIDVTHWRDSRSLWAAAAAAEPTNAYARAGYAETLDDPAEAERQYELALTEHPSSGVRLRIMTNLAAVCQKQGKVWQAVYWANHGRPNLPAANSASPQVSGPWRARAWGNRSTVPPPRPQMWLTPSAPQE